MKGHWTNEQNAYDQYLTDLAVDNYDPPYVPAYTYLGFPKGWEPGYEGADSYWGKF